jgi:hypothetical protein
VADLQSKVKRLKINGTLLISEGVLCVWILIRVCISHKSSFVVFCCMMRARAREREQAQLNKIAESLAIKMCLWQRKFYVVM